MAVTDRRGADRVARRQAGVRRHRRRRGVVDRATPRRGRPPRPRTPERRRQRPGRCSPHRGTPAAASSSTAGCRGPVRRARRAGPWSSSSTSPTSGCTPTRRTGPTSRGRSPPCRTVGGGLRWVDPQLHLGRGEVWCVLEEFTGASPTDVRRVIAAVPLDGSAAEDRGAVRELTDDRHRFVTGPRLSHDGRRVAWIAWDHPRMPWDGTVVKMADVTADGDFTGVRPLVGDPDEVGRPGGVGPRRLAALRLGPSAAGGSSSALRPDAAAGAVVPTSRLCAAGARSSAARCGRSDCAGSALDNGLIAVIHGRGTTALGVLDPETGELVDAVGPWTAWAATLAVQGTRVIGVAASPAQLVRDRRARHGHGAHPGHRRTRTRTRSTPPTTPNRRSVPSPDPAGREIHAHVYPPRHPGRTAPDGELAALRHLGARRSHRPRPARTRPGDRLLHLARHRCRRGQLRRLHRLRPRLPRPAARAVGRRRRGGLRGRRPGRWPRRAPPTATRLAIRGGSAGRLDHRRLAHRAPMSTPAAAIIYPILDLEGWATGETHDFESQYLESLVGPYAEVPDRYRERSPVNHAGPDHRPVPAAPGTRRRDLPARPVRAVPRRDRGARDPARLPHLRGRGPRLPQGGHDECAHWRPNSPCTRRRSASTAPDVPRLELKK